MTDAELRAIVRETVARHLTAARQQASAPGLMRAPAVHTGSESGEAWGQHPSHYLYLTVVNTTDACVIEPAEPCDHCGYCRSHGH